jgi:hypothetical protein
MGLINWIFDFYQHSRIEEARREAKQARDDLYAVRAREGGVDVERLQRALEELSLATKALQRMMIEKKICSPGDFRGMLEQIDREDGRIDGRSPL